MPGTDTTATQGNSGGAITQDPFAPAKEPETNTLIMGQSPPDDNRKMFDSFVPDSYKSKEYVQNIAKAENPREELFKQYEHAQSLIGKQQTLNVPTGEST